MSWSDIIDEIGELKHRDMEIEPMRVGFFRLCPSCARRVIKYYFFCPGCGQRLKWSDRK